MTYKQEQIKPYDKTSDKSKQVEKMFDNIAHSYDKLNHRLSWNIDKRWRKKAIQLLKEFEPNNILDIATGTGDFAIQAAKMNASKQIIGVDISEGMINAGLKKVEKEKLSNIISLKKENCLHLSFPDNSFDATTAAFGIRNFANLELGLKEMYRVLREGGHLCVIELTTPIAHPMKELFKIYSHSVLPFYGRIISGDKSAYSYLTATIEAFPQGEEMVKILKKVGFKSAIFKRLTLGICTMYIATK